MALGRSSLLFLALLAAACQPVDPPLIEGPPQRMVPRSEAPGSAWVDGVEHAARIRLVVQYGTPVVRFSVAGFTILEDGRVLVEGDMTDVPRVFLTAYPTTLSLVDGDLHITEMQGTASPVGEVDLTLDSEGETSGFVSATGMWELAGPFEVWCDAGAGVRDTSATWRRLRTYDGDTPDIEVNCATGERRTYLAP